MSFGNRRVLHKLDHCFPHSFRHPQRTPSETQLLHTEIMLIFPKHVIFTAVMIFYFFAYLQHTRYWPVVHLITLKSVLVCCQLCHLPTIFLLRKQLRDKIQLCY